MGRGRTRQGLPEHEPAMPKIDDANGLVDGGGLYRGDLMLT